MDVVKTMYRNSKYEVVMCLELFTNKIKYAVRSIVRVDHGIVWTGYDKAEAIEKADQLEIESEE